MIGIFNYLTGEQLTTVNSLEEFVQFSEDFYEEYGLTFHIVATLANTIDVEVLEWDGEHYNIV